SRIALTTQPPVALASRCIVTTRVFLAMSPLGSLTGAEIDTSFAPIAEPGSPRSAVMPTIWNSVTMPCVVGSNLTVASRACAALPRSRDALKNSPRSACSCAPEQPASVAAAPRIANSRRILRFGRAVSSGLLVFFFDQARDRHDLVVAFDVDQRHALRRAADRADVVGLHPDDHALLRDHQQLVAFLYVRDAYDETIPLRRRDIDDADAAARLHAVLFNLGALAEPALGDRQQRAARFDDFHRHDEVVATQIDAADAVRRAAHRPDVGLGETDGHAVARGDEHLAAAVGHLNGDHGIAVFDTHRDDAARSRIAERRQLGLLDDSLPRAHDDELVFGELLDRHHRGDLLALFHRDEIGDRLPLAARTDVGNLVDLQPVRAAAIRENHDVGVRRRDEQMADEILVACPHADAALAAAALIAIRRDRRPLDVAGVADRDRHVFLGDQIFDVDLARLPLDHLRAPIVAVGFADGFQFVDDDLHQQAVAREDRAQPLDGLQQLRELVENLLPLQAGEALQLHVEDRLRLDRREAELRDQPLARFGRGF